MTDFKRVGLAGRPEYSRTADTMQRLLAVLQQRGIGVVLDEGCALPASGEGDSARAGCKASAAYLTYPTEELPAHCDLLIVVGGDGSMLNIAPLAVAHQIPVIGVNRGRLGFLTDILPEPQPLEAALNAVLAGDYVEESRFLFDVYQEPAVNGKPAETLLGSALNDVVLHAGAAAQMIEFELHINGEKVYSLVADGLIVATPTGSTAYALSAGGPIMHPHLDAIALVPLNPHSLSSRPIVVAGDSEIRLVVAEKSRGNARISCDGRQTHQPAAVGECFLLHKKPQPLKLIHPTGHSFYESCRSKLGWGTGMARHGGN